MANRTLDDVTINGRKSRMSAPQVKQEGNPNQVPANVGSDKNPKARTVRGGKANSGFEFGRGDGAERSYPSDTSNI